MADRLGVSWCIQVTCVYIYIYTSDKNQWVSTKERNSDVPVKTEQGARSEKRVPILTCRVRPVCIIFRLSSDKDPFGLAHVSSFAGEIDDAELGLPPEPVLPTPAPRHTDCSAREM